MAANPRHEGGGARAELLHVEAVTKTFGALKALNDVSLSVASGEIHGLVGHNGAGKSTLIKILSGYQTADSGRLRLAGTDYDLRHLLPNECGVGTVQQDLGIVPDMSVSDNVFVGERGPGQHFGQLRRGKEAKGVRALLEDGLRVHGLDVSRVMADIPRNAWAIVAVARALVRLESGPESGVLILDEPTASLDESDSEVVLRVMREVADRGHAVIFVSHRLQEVSRACERATCLRNGEVVAEFARGQRPIDPDDLGEAISGARGQQRIAQPRSALPEMGDTDVGCDLRELTGVLLRGVSLHVRYGEILAVTGLRGSGYEEIFEVVTGVGEDVGAASGQVILDGEAVKRQPAALRAAGVALIPKDRKRYGLWMDGTGVDNISAGGAMFEAVNRFWRVSTRREIDTCRQRMVEMDVRPPEPELPMSSLSGGNQQKVLYARELLGRSEDTKLVLADEPVEGVDVGTRSELAARLQDRARSGAAIVVCTGDVHLIRLMADRVAVLKDGALAGYLSVEGLDDNELARLQEVGSVARTV